MNHIKINGVWYEVNSKPKFDVNGNVIIEHEGTTYVVKIQSRKWYVAIRAV